VDWGSYLYNSGLGPLPTQQWTGAPTYTTTDRNKYVNVIKLNMYLLYWYIQQNQCLNIKKHDVHNIAWAPMLAGPPGNYIYED
jgi:hypothetical protein